VTTTEFVADHVLAATSDWMGQTGFVVMGVLVVVVGVVVVVVAVVVVMMMMMMMMMQTPYIRR